MISVIHNHGTSFKGLMAYLLHDADHAKTSDRVAWTHTHNLAADEPEVAWKFMVATATSQADLKAEAGIKNTGRKSNKHVMHYTLSWHEEERAELTRDEMIEAAMASMAYIGTHEGEKIGKRKAQRTQYADEHQAIIVCHEEPGKSPHVHIALNRVHPEHGVMLPDSKDYEKLSAWALEYRQAQGKEHYCPERQKNAAKKAQGLKTSHRRKPRAAYEAEQEMAAVDPGSRKVALLAQQRRRAAELKSKTEAMKKRQAKAVHALEDRHVAGERAERVKSARAIRANRARIRAAYASKIDALTERQAAETAAFEKARRTAAGHVRNAWAALKTKEWMTEIRTRPIRAATKAFKLAFDSGLQQRDIERHHAREQRALHGARRREERDAAREIRADEGGRLEDLRRRYLEQRSNLKLEYGMDRAKLKAEWRQLQEDRLAAMAEDDRARPTKPTPGGGPLPAGGRRQGKQDPAAGSIEPGSALDGNKSSTRRQTPQDESIEELRSMARQIRRDEKAQDDREQGRSPERGE